MAGGIVSRQKGHNMSHFSVLVPCDNEEHLGEMLLPYHEYECTGIEDYVEFVPLDDDDIEWYTDLYNEIERQVPFDEWMKQDGLEFQGNRWGRRTNPNKKWDYWRTGGRWSRKLLLRDGERMNVAKAGEVAWETMRTEQGDEGRSGFVRLCHSLKLVGYTLDDFYTENITKEAWKQASRTLDAAHKKEPDRYMDYMDVVLTGFDYKGIYTEEKAYECYYSKALTFAFIDIDGNWHERATMGWWGMTHDDKPDYDSEFWTFIENLPDDKNVVVVDCHI